MSKSFDSLSYSPRLAEIRSWTYPLHCLVMILFAAAISGCDVHGNIIGSSTYSVLATAFTFTTVEDGPTASATSEAYGMTADSSGNLIIVGSVNGALDGQTLHGSSDMFITQYNAYGVRQWTVQDGGTSGTTTAWGVATDSAGNIYVSGGTNVALDGQTQHGTNDLFLTKYSSAGIRQWTVQDGASSDNAVAYGVTVDSSGSVYIGGYTTVAIDGQTQHGSSDLFISKYNSSGVRQWTVQDGTASGTTVVTGITADTSANIYITGYTNKAIDGQTLHGTQDLYIAKYNSSGTRQWTIEDGASSGQTEGTGIAVDILGNIYVTGYTNKAIDSQTLHGTADLFITKYNSTGTLQWTVEDGVSGGFTHSLCLTTDASANVYIAGLTTNGIDGQTQHGADDVFTSKYNSSGALQWTEQDGVSSTGTTYAAGIVNLGGYSYVTGFTNKAIDGQTKHGGSDFFLVRYNSTGVEDSP